MLLFDGFDEIPDVLRATESDGTVVKYANSIIIFVRGYRCRAVIASREFRGPSFRLPRFRIAPMNERRQRNLIRSSGLSSHLQGLVLEGMAGADRHLRLLAQNPLSLRLVCEYIKDNGEFPQHLHAVFASYVAARFATDAPRVEGQRKLSSTTVRAYAEEICFCMAAVDGLGLSPSRGRLHAAVTEQGRLTPSRLDAVLDALIDMRLGRWEPNPNDSADPTFTFNHRRIQEYFAACVVLRVPDRVAPTTLLIDGRWREVAVSVLQTGPSEVVALLLATAEVLIAAFGTVAEEPRSGQTGDDPNVRSQDELSAPSRFHWPPAALHILDVLAVGLGDRPEQISPAARAAVGELLMRAWRHGLRHDRLWVLDMILIAPEHVVVEIVTSAFESPSEMLRDVAYSRVARLPELPVPIKRGIRGRLFTLWATGELRDARLVVETQLRRFTQAPDLMATYRLLRTIMGTDLALLTGLGLFLAVQPTASRAMPPLMLALLLLGAHAGLWLRRHGLSHSFMPRSDRTALVSWVWPPQSMALTARTLGRVARLAMAGFIGYCLIRQGGPSVIVIVDCIAVLYALAWADVAMDLALIGESIRRRAWPLIPLRWWWRREAGGNMFDIRLLDALMAIAKEIGILVLVAFLLGLLWLLYELARTVGLAGLVQRNLAAIGNLLSDVDWLTHFLKVAWDVYQYIFFGFMIVTVIGFALLLIFAPFRTRRNRLELLADLRSNAMPIDATALIEILERIDTPRTAREVMAALRETPGAYLPDALVLLADVVAAVEGGGHQRYQSASPETLGHPAHVTVPPAVTRHSPTGPNGKQLASLTCCSISMRRRSMKSAASCMNIEMRMSLSRRASHPPGPVQIAQAPAARHCDHFRWKAETGEAGPRRWYSRTTTHQPIPPELVLCRGNSAPQAHAGDRRHAQSA